jgi:hypothetical protein
VQVDLDAVGLQAAGFQHLLQQLLSDQLSLNLFLR